MPSRKSPNLSLLILYLSKLLFPLFLYIPRRTLVETNPGLQLFWRCIEFIASLERAELLLSWRAVFIFLLLPYLGMVSVTPLTVGLWARPVQCHVTHWWIQEWLRNKGLWEPWACSVPLLYLHSWLYSPSSCSTLPNCSNGCLFRLDHQTCNFLFLTLSLNVVFIPSLIIFPLSFPG